jgi:hypothetical protein
MFNDLTTLNRGRGSQNKAMKPFSQPRYFKESLLLLLLLFPVAVAVICDRPWTKENVVYNKKSSEIQKHRGRWNTPARNECQSYGIDSHRECYANE